MITYEDLVNYDPNPSMRGEYERFLCPYCGDEHSRDPMHQSLSLKKDGYFVCHRCGSRGVLGGFTRPPLVRKNKREIMRDRFSVS